MYFLYKKNNGEISPTVRMGIPSQRALNKERDCEIGSGIKWENVDLFYAPDDEFADDFVRTAPLGRYYIEDDVVYEDMEWEEPEEEEWL